MRFNKFKKAMTVFVMIILCGCLCIGCGQNTDKASETSANIIPSDEEISESLLYEHMQFYYRYATKYNIDAPIFKERKKVAAYITKKNYENNQDKLIYVDCDRSLFSGECYTRTLQKSEYTYWGELNGEGEPDGIGMLCRIFTELNYDDPELFILYIGEFSDGYYDGYGVKFNFPDIFNDYPNAIFSQMNQDNIGVYNNPIYEGYFSKGEYNGEGVEIICNIGGIDINTGELQLDPEIADYCLYIGGFEDGELNGIAKIYEYKGILEYEGGFSNDEYNGEGVLYYIEYPNQIKYKGEFSRGEFQGKGILYDENGKVVHKGKFRAGNIV